MLLLQQTQHAASAVSTTATPGCWDTNMVSLFFQTTVQQNNRQNRQHGQGWIWRMTRSKQQKQMAQGRIRSYVEGFGTSLVDCCMTNHIYNKRIIRLFLDHQSRHHHWVDLCPWPQGRLLQQPAGYWRRHSPETRWFWWNRWDLPAIQSKLLPSGVQVFSWVQWGWTKRWQWCRFWWYVNWQQASTYSTTQPDRTESPRQGIALAFHSGTRPRICEGIHSISQGRRNKLEELELHPTSFTTRDPESSIIQCSSWPSDQSSSGVQG